jgi:hypothetical protein
MRCKSAAATINQVLADRAAAAQAAEAGRRLSRRSDIFGFLIDFTCEFPSS